MKYKRLGKTNLMVSELGFGAWGIGGNKYGNSYGPTDDRTSLEALRVALELGCTLFDTADVYGHGHSERLLGRAVREAGTPHDVVIASKVGTNFSNGPAFLDFTRSHILSAIEATLRRLDRDYLDLYQLHNPPLEAIRSAEVFDALDELKASGKIHHYGVSIHSVPEGFACLENQKPETLQLVYNLFSLINPERSPERLFASIAQQDVGLIAREPLAGGFLSGLHCGDTQYGPGDVRGELLSAERAVRIDLAASLRYLEHSGVTRAQAALRFVLDEPAVTTVLVGIKTPAQVRENFAAAGLACFDELATAASA